MVKTDIFSLGFNWWLSPIFNVNVNYRCILNDREGQEGDSSGMLARLLLVLE